MLSVVQLRVIPDAWYVQSRQRRRAILIISYQHPACTFLYLERRISQSLYPNERMGWLLNVDGVQGCTGKKMEFGSRERKSKVALFPFSLSHYYLFNFPAGTLIVSLTSRQMVRSYLK